MKLTEILEKEIYDVIYQEQFDDVSIIEVLGILDGIKYDLIKSAKENTHA